MIITIDGPSATGKSTIAKGLAKKLSYHYFDTGAMYRSFTYYLIQEKIDSHNEDSLKKALETFSFSIEVIGEKKHYIVCGEDVTQAIRGVAVTHLVSEVAAIGLVREQLVHWQREYASTHDVIFEGRDLGSVVFPKADIKIYLTCEDTVRAERRYKELVENYPDQAKLVTQESVLKDMQQRDLADETRAHSPLVIPEGAHVIDTSHLTQDGVIKEILALL